MPRISKATEYNWKRLNSDSRGRLTRRANKTQSARRITATGYLDDPEVNALLQSVLAVEAGTDDIMYTLVRSAFSQRGLLQKRHVQEFLRNYATMECLDIDVPKGMWDTDKDILGFIYQSLITEGERNITGQYYTAGSVVAHILNGKVLSDTETFLDPCCGSGAFLMGVSTDNPSNLYGFDINPIAVMIASANLILKYCDREFTPHIYRIDYLGKGVLTGNGADIPRRFDNIYTNPPWGSDREGLYAAGYPMIRSGERASMVIAESLARLKENGTMYFLLPASLLKTRSHVDIRRHILSNTTIRQIDLYKGRFDGVFTGYFSIKASPRKTRKQTYLVTSDSGNCWVTLSDSDYAAGRIALQNFSKLDNSIISKMESSCNDKLSHSTWALGIVTGDNKNKVKKEKSEGLVPVYVGRHVDPFKLQGESSYISFDPKNFQQCAREEYFRAPEKLIYRFIARYPIVAYDDKQCVCLNSANILIPEVDSISIKSVAALLNSTLYHYYYTLRFPDIKVLKGNLQELPFPKLTKEQDEELCSLVTDIRSTSFSTEYRQELDRKVYSIFGINPVEQEQIASRLR